MGYVLLFLLIVAVVSFTGALIKPIPLKKSLREGFVLFLTTVAGLGLVALIVFLLSR